MRGWERVTPTDVARLTDRCAPPTAVEAPPAKPQKYRAEPCIVTADGTLFTTADILTAEATVTKFPLKKTAPLLERAARVGITGRWFASTKEGRRYLELCLLERAGAICDLRCQVEYDLKVRSMIDGLEHTIGRWIADFQYRRQGEIAIVTEDTKSTATKTPLYRRSRRHFETQYGLRILET